MHARPTRTFATRTVLVLAVGALLIAGCTPGDANDVNGDAAVDDVDSDNGDTDDATAEMSSEESAQDGDAGQGTPIAGATVIWNGAELVTTGVICEEFGIGAGAVDVESIEATIADVYGHEGAFRAMWSIEDDRMERVVLTWEEEDGFEVFRADFRNDDPQGTIEFDGYTRAHGELELVAGTDRAQELEPEGGIVEFDVSCDA